MGIVYNIYNSDIIPKEKLLNIFIRTLDNIDEDIPVEITFCILLIIILAHIMKTVILPFSRAKNNILNNKQHPRYYCHKIQDEYAEILFNMWNNYSYYREDIDLRSLPLAVWEQIGNDFQLISDAYTMEEHQKIYYEVQNTIDNTQENKIQMIYPEFVEALIALSRYQIRDIFIDIYEATCLFLEKLSRPRTYSKEIDLE